MRRESKFVLVRVCASVSASATAFGETGLPRGGRALLEERWWHWEAEISVWSGFPGGGGATPHFIIFLKCFPLLRKKKSFFLPFFDLRVITKSVQIGVRYVCVFACVRLCVGV